VFFCRNHFVISSAACRSPPHVLAARNLPMSHDCVSAWRTCSYIRHSGGGRITMTMGPPWDVCLVYAAVIRKAAFLSWVCDNLPMKSTDVPDSHWGIFQLQQPPQSPSRSVATPPSLHQSASQPLPIPPMSEAERCRTSILPERNPMASASAVAATPVANKPAPRTGAPLAQSGLRSVVLLR